MIRYNWFISSVFFTAASIALMSPGATAIALLFFVPLAIILPTTNKSSRNGFGGEGEIKRAVVLVSLILFCSLLPQADTNNAVFTSPIEDLKNNWHHS